MRYLFGTVANIIIILILFETIEKYLSEFFMRMDYIIDIKEFREVNKLRQNDLAEYLGISQTFLSQIEQGNRPLAQKHIRKILNDKKFVTTMIKEKPPRSKKQDRVLMDREVFDLLKNQSETILSQQRTIESLAKGDSAQPADHAGCVDAG